MGTLENRPHLNPQFDSFEKNLEKTNQLPRFVTMDGPVREAKFKLNPDGRTPDSGVHSIFTITGPKDAYGCALWRKAFSQHGGKRSANPETQAVAPVVGGPPVTAG